LTVKKRKCNIEWLGQQQFNSGVQNPDFYLSDLAVKILKTFSPQIH